ncbi:MAG: hypothetical protein IPI79_10115 [Moraxellaceae bacterium]|nr:hypothetical protein [Moraxellaceae bacterium]
MLANLDANINFAHIDTEMYRIDLEELGKRYYIRKLVKGIMPVEENIIKLF